MIQRIVFEIFRKIFGISEILRYICTKNNKDENNIQKYIGWILYQESSGEDSTGGMVREDEEVGMDLFRWYQEYV